MKANRQSIRRAVERPEDSVRFYLFHGPDEAQSRALAARLAETLGAARFLISAATIKADPAALADEAGAMNLFGGKRLIWIEPAGDDIAAGVEALLETNAGESPVVAIAGSLRKTSALLKLAEASAAAMAFASYVPEGADAERMVVEAGRRVGLNIESPIAARIADSCSNDQAVVAQELEKIALYLDASPQSPKSVDREAIEAVGAALSEENRSGLVDLALSGDLRGLAGELAHAQALDGIPIVRALQRRILGLVPARARIERGESAGAVMTSLGKSLFWKEKPLFEQLLSRWDAAGLATVFSRTSRLEHALLFSEAPEAELVGEELVAIARAARRR